MPIILVCVLNLIHINFHSSEININNVADYPSRIRKRHNQKIAEQASNFIKKHYCI